MYFPDAFLIQLFQFFPIPLLVFIISLKGKWKSKQGQEEMKAAKDHTGKQKETQLESGRIKSQFFLTKRKKKNGKH